MLLDSLLCPAPVLANFLYAFSESNTPGKVIIYLLFGFSVFAWTIMISKGLALRKAREETAVFLSMYRKEKQPTALFMKKRVFAESPVYRIYERGCALLGDELVQEDADPGYYRSLDSTSRGTITPSQLEALRSLNERSVAEQAVRLEEYMIFLATSVSVSPFLGLLGTVWGVMDSFGGMGVTGAATLSSVAPGIAGALLTTIVGLIVALPSTVGYNLLSGNIRKQCVEMDNFAQEFTADVQRHHLDQP